MYKVKKTESHAKLIPLYLLVIVPLLVMGHRYSTGLGKYAWFGQEEQIDFFYYYKMWATVIIATIMLVMLISHLWSGKKLVKFTKREWIQFVPLAGYMILSFLSTAVSKYSYFGFHGGYEQFEAVWAVLGYGIIAFYAFAFISSAQASQYVLYAVTASTGIIAIIGAFQAVGLDFFKTGVMKSILSASAGSQISFMFEKNRTYTTLYNPNYVGVFCVLMIPVMISLLIESKKLWEKIVYGVVTLLLLVSLVGCQSKTGIIMLAGILVVMVLFYRKWILEHKKIAIPVIAVLCIAFVGLIAWRGSDFVTALKSSFIIQKTETAGWDSMKTTDENVQLCYDGHWFCLSLNQGAANADEVLVAEDENGNSLRVKHEEQGNAIVYSEDRSIQIPVQYGYITQQDLGFAVDYVSRFVFVYKDGKYLYYAGEDKMQSVDSDKVAQAECLDGYEHLFSRRGYIWKVTLPLLKDRIFLGSGQDSYTLVVPNDDFAGKSKNGYFGQILTKPHNIYLQMACQDGVLAMLLCAFVWLYYLIQAFRNQWKVKERPLASVGIMIGVLGYVLMGILNDSTIAVAPIFWLLLGLGIRQNYEMNKARKEQAEEVKEIKEA